MTVFSRHTVVACGLVAGLAGALTSPPALSGGEPTSLRIDYAERPVREFLKLHFSGSRAFSATGLDKKDRFLTRRFRTAMYKYFQKVRDAKTDIPLVIDPFTGSQGATTYSVGDAKVRGEKAWVPVTFGDGNMQWTITYLLRDDQERNDDRWRIDDIEDRRGTKLTQLLKQ